MKKQWKEPKLELLDIKETMASFKGDSWDGFFLLADITNRILIREKT